ncbi:Proton myo-inositol cotransporter [Blattella germanica]|nr:Proton myo-inositol cotransporter [Blattella germanica]
MQVAWVAPVLRYDEALKVLRSIRGDDYPIQEELESIKESCLEQENEVQERRQAGGSSSIWLQILTTKSTRRALLLGCLLQGFQQLAGINTVMYYSASIIQMAGVKDYSIAIWLACATAAINFFCTFIGLYLVERIGRRPLTLWSLGECISAECGFCYYDLATGAANGSCWSLDQNSLANSGICSNKTALSGNSGLTWAADWCPSKYSWVAVVALGIYLLFFAPGMGPMPWTINSEIYPMWARSSCNSLATSTNWMFNLLISMTFLTLTELVTREGAFYIYAGFAGVGLITLIFLLPETKGKSLEEMETVFSGPWCMTFGSADSKNIQYVHIRGLNRDCREDEADSGDSDS